MSEIIFFCIVILAILILGVYGITIAQKNKGYGLIKQNTDSMRGIAICMIAASHIAQFTSMGGIARNFVFLWGGMGVAIFFCSPVTEITFQYKKQRAGLDGS